MSERLAAVMEFYGVQVNADRQHQLVLCPMGHEAHPSCSLNLDKGLWNCFSCGAAGDELTLIQKKENCDYPASVRRLVEIAGASDSTVRGQHRSGRGVSGGKGYKPKFRRSVPSGVRRYPGDRA